MTFKKVFEIKSYGKSELASKYLPDVEPKSAQKTIRQWIDRYPGLSQQLAATGFSPLNKRYTPAQVRLIVEAFGEP